MLFTFPIIIWYFMSMIKTIIVLAAFSSPVSPGEELLSSPYFQDALKTYCRENDLGINISFYGDYDCHLSTYNRLKERYATRHELPPLRDVDRLLPETALHEIYELQRGLKGFYERRREVDWNKDHYDALINDLKDKMGVSSLMMKAHVEKNYDPYDVRLALKQLRERVGVAAYYGGDWPPLINFSAF